MERGREEPGLPEQPGVGVVADLGGRVALEAGLAGRGVVGAEAARLLAAGRAKGLTDRDETTPTSQRDIRHRPRTCAPTGTGRRTNRYQTRFCRGAHHGEVTKNKKVDGKIAHKSNLFSRTLQVVMTKDCVDEK